MRQVDFVALVDAAESLETISLATRISQLVGLPVEKAYPDLGPTLLAALPEWPVLACLP